MSPRAKNPKKEEITKATSSPTLKESAAIQNEEKKAFYIVGMGGSAGSLEAFEEFFRNMPSDSGLAFVLVPTSIRLIKA